MIDALTRKTVRQYVMRRILLYALLLLPISFVASSYLLAFWLQHDIATTRPWSFLQYFILLDMEAPYPTAWFFATFLPFFALAMFIGIAYTGTLFPAATHFGSARWASQWDHVKAGMFNPFDYSLILGAARVGYLTADLFTHVCVFAPTRSGKGIGIVLPNMLTWKGSVIAIDIKSELWELTSGYRNTLGDAYIFAPGKLNSFSYNPLDHIPRDDIHRFGAVQGISHIIIKTPPKSNPMWTAEARALTVASILCLMDMIDGETTFGNVYRLINGITFDPQSMEAFFKNHPDLDRFTTDTFTRFAVMNADQRAGVIATALSSLEIFSDPVIDAATSSSSFSIHDLRKSPTSIYLAVDPREFDRMAPLLNLVLQQISGALTHDIKRSQRGIPVLLGLEEFPALGPLPSITNALGFYAGYNVRVLAIAQNVHQITRVYPDSHKEILASFRHKIYYAPNTPEEAKSISVACGNCTKPVVSTTTSRGGKSTSRSYVKAPLIDESEVMQLAHDDEIIIQEYQPPTRTKKLNVLRIPKLWKRTKIAPPPVPFIRPTLSEPPGSDDYEHCQEALA